MSDCEGEHRPSFAVPKYKKNYIEFEAQLNAYVMYKGSQIAFKPNKSADYFPQGEILLSRDRLTHFDADKVLQDVVMEVNEEPSDFKDR